MKFLLSEGRIICLLEKEDGEDLVKNHIPVIELLLVPLTLRDHLENSHIWPQVIKKVKNGLRNVVYF